jgi:hypothetical protein
MVPSFALNGALVVRSLARHVEVAVVVTAAVAESIPMLPIALKYPIASATPVVIQPLAPSPASKRDAGY